MSDDNQLLDKYEQNVEYITNQGGAYSADADMIKESAPAPTAEERMIPSKLESPVEKHKQELDSATSQADAKSVSSMGNGLAKAALIGVAGAVLGTIATALAGKVTAQINRTVKGVGDTAKDVTNGVNHTVKDAMNSVKDIVEDTELAAKGAIDTASDHQTFKLYEERLVADKKKVNTAEVSIGKHVKTQTAHISVSLEKERVVVERITPVDAETPVVGEANFYEGEIARIKVYEETPDVQKLAFLREEISVRKEVEEVSVEVEDKIRREELDVDIQDTNVINEIKTL